MKLVVLGLVVSVSVASADPAIHRIVRDDTVVADSPSLTLAINDAFRATKAEHGNQWDCSYGEATNLVISWACSGVVDDGPYTGGSTHANTMRSFAIENGKLVELDLKKVWAPNTAAKVAKLEGSSSYEGAECILDGSRGTDFFVTQHGLEKAINDTSQRCDVSWADVVPLLLPNSPLARVAAAEIAASADGADPIPGPLGDAPAKKTPTGRFVGDGDAVRDTQSGLEWAAKDNGADIDAEGAAAYAKAYRGGGHADWRLPTIDELAAISAPDLGHKDKADCTKGKSTLLISSSIHISCGLAWSTTTSTNGQSAFGFISGTPRVSKPTEKKNYRALVVRKR